MHTCDEVGQVLLLLLLRGISDQLIDAEIAMRTITKTYRPRRPTDLLQNTETHHKTVYTTATVAHPTAERRLVHLHCNAVMLVTNIQTTKFCWCSETCSTVSLLVAHSLATSRDVQKLVMSVLTVLHRTRTM